MDKPPPQEAHEAIRPTNISLYELSETIGSSTAAFGSKERRM
jgi:DNA topoisomerase IA